ncbi:hypothetical protein Vqi01_55740 [Micromonospora qiuiae]|uniref:Uncharacterized protein n=1 Tax=Micromonospora qiuiae TaxID=502268 RepID=A0ABQ4JLN6_9ACTN|nr:hypothetical protein Vqi01_55740 [Micromonospora qiuiae]
MTNEVTVPLLPCASIDDIETFYGVLGFRSTHKQRKPNACVARPDRFPTPRAVPLLAPSRQRDQPSTVNCG